ncbi:MAG: hypothetical protein LBU53_12755 [Zoogloeaceae bacterium]|jgi:hypothetical protein|nr:hypothetical protein [Zoogloeaceae bacterium]
MLLSASRQSRLPESTDSGTTNRKTRNGQTPLFYAALQHFGGIFSQMFLEMLAEITDSFIAARRRPSFATSQGRLSNACCV